MNTWRGPSAVTASTADASPASATAFGVFRLVSARLESISFLSFLGSPRDRKSTRLNSSHSQISYAVFCLKKKQYDPPDISRIWSLDYPEEIKPGMVSALETQHGHVHAFGVLLKEMLLYTDDAHELLYTYA